METSDRGLNSASAADIQPRDPKHTQCSSSIPSQPPSSGPMQFSYPRHSQLALAPPDAVVAHIVVVGFHATLGATIEFAYPPLRDSVALRAPQLSDTLDLSAGATDTSAAAIDSVQASAHSIKKVAADGAGEKEDRKKSTEHDWGVLPSAWSYLPLLALPDGVHDRMYDTVYFMLPPAVHCVACFRQIKASDVKNHSATREQDSEAVSRGSVQKSIVLLCRRPLYGALAERLVGGVRAYFNQRDFARTDVLAALFHALNSSFARPSLNVPATLFHGLDLRSLLCKLGRDLLCIIKLVLLEKRVVIHSQPIYYASNAIAAVASIFPGALDATAPDVQPLERSENFYGGDDAARTNGALAVDEDQDGTASALALFGPEDAADFEPYAPLPMLMDLLRGTTSRTTTFRNASRRGCLVGTSQNVAVLLGSQMQAGGVGSGTSGRNKMRSAQEISSDRSSSRAKQRSSDEEVGSKATGSHRRYGSSSALSGAPSSTTSAAASRHLPEVDVLVDVADGRVVYRTETIRKLVALSGEEVMFVDELIALARESSINDVNLGTVQYAGSDDHLRRRFRRYIACFLHSMACVCATFLERHPERRRAYPVPSSTKQPAPAGVNAAESEFDKMRLEPAFDPFNARFASAWITGTHNGFVWSYRSKRVVRSRAGAHDDQESSTAESPDNLFMGPPQPERPIDSVSTQDKTGAHGADRPSNKNKRDNRAHKTTEAVVAPADGSNELNVMDRLGGALYDSITSIDTSAAMNEVSSFGTWAFDTMSGFFAPFAGDEEGKASGKTQGEWNGNDRADAGRNMVSVSTQPLKSSSHGKSKNSIESREREHLQIPQNCDITSMETPKVPPPHASNDIAASGIRLAPSARRNDHR